MTLWRNTNLSQDMVAPRFSLCRLMFEENGLERKDQVYI